MKRLIQGVVVLMLCLPATLPAQSDSTAAEKNVPPEGWNLSSEVALFQSQSTYSDNWDGEEQGTVAWHATFTGTADRSFSKRTNNRSSLTLEYGQTQTQDRGEATWSAPAKSFDAIRFESVSSFDFNRGLGPFVSGRLESNFTDYENQREIYFNPMKLSESAGISKTFLRDKERFLNARLGAAIRQTWDKNEAPTDTLHLYSETYVSDAGLELVGKYVTPLFNKRVKLDAELVLFQALHNSEAMRLGDSWKSVDIDFRADFNTTITEWISVYTRIRFKYDQEISKAGRFKELLELGVTYSLL